MGVEDSGWAPDDVVRLAAMWQPPERIMHELPGFRPLAEASRSVGSPQIRNLGTVGGNLGTASPAGDALPVLAAYDADVDVASAARGVRTLPWRAFLVGVKRNALEPDELILGVRWRMTRGPGSYSKIGTRNAMVISMAGLCLVLDEPSRSVRVALGAAGAQVVRFFVGQGLRLASIGILIGLALSAAAVSVLSASFLGLSAADAIPVAAVSILLALSSLGAVWIPARRAARVDPMVALRSD
jgi:hypothetical protein